MEWTIRLTDTGRSIIAEWGETKLEEGYDKDNQADRDEAIGIVFSTLADWFDEH